jgi:GT2 family glycosyltransferase
LSRVEDILLDAQDDVRVPGSLASLPTVSIIVPVHKDGDSVRQCLESLSRLSPRPLEVIIVSDGPCGEWGALARRLGFAVVTMDRSGGAARARNAGARAARGDILFFVDSDVTVPTGAVGRVTNVFVADASLSALIGSYDDAPACQDFLSQYRNLLHHYVHQSSSEEGGTFWGACGAIRRGVFEQVSGFDESYRGACIEDIELGYRLGEKGRRIALCKSLQVKHWKRWTAWSLVKTDFLYRALPWTTLILRRGRMENDLNLRTASRVSVALVGAMAILLAAAIWRPWLLAGAAVCVAGLAALNWPWYRFLAQKRSWWFAMRAMPWHWVYYFLGGAAFLAGVMLHVWRKLPVSRRARPSASFAGQERS